MVFVLTNWYNYSVIGSHFACELICALFSFLSFFYIFLMVIVNGVFNNVNEDNPWNLIIKERNLISIQCCIWYFFFLVIQDCSLWLDFYWNMCNHTTRSFSYFRWQIFVCVYTLLAGPDNFFLTNFIFLVSNS